MAFNVTGKVQSQTGKTLTDMFKAARISKRLSFFWLSSHEKQLTYVPFISKSVIWSRRLVITGLTWSTGCCTPCSAPCRILKNSDAKINDQVAPITDLLLNQQKQRALTGNNICRRCWKKSKCNWRLKKVGMLVGGFSRSNENHDVQHNAEHTQH